MRAVAALACGIVPVLLFIACAKPAYVRTEERSSYFEVSPRMGGYNKSVAVTMKSGAPTQFGPQAEAAFMQVLIDVVRNPEGRIALKTPDDPDYPGFMNIYSPITAQKTFNVAQTARRQGVHALIQGAVENILVHEEKRGFWWFRKTVYYLDMVFSLDVYDTGTGAKIMSEVHERTERIDSEAYKAFLSGDALDAQALNKLVAKSAERLGRQASRAIRSGKWICSVAGIQNLEVTLVPGRSAGLKVGDRLAVYEGRRIIDGPQGERFIVPGHEVGRITITAVDEDSASASFEGAADIRTGDIVVPFP